ncbi:hypothetical protein UAY_00126 [Enterococcus moraviensis ATCC BAA-383]|uniref:Uncharacterized protein n=1 Tax=Enterococcus moraviensis ATCC BAA-383 TaxID=1158609 RepID=R2TNK5_9ENTE|nr:DUF916 and DUF3324 domain-containing protein [Enterococcus moraviensis]EOI06784.1 hypothetical protein UAY_00126 [Enterococcus moraviensis ATCC BAA-383]EOT65121.1 hypothetical protein I586_02855 [Enterococcus moraviensis ATCC BAA-383]OJG66966.1 hypothetical protein RV09_GL003183 [Enterococcus moraviensis]
MKTTTKIYLFLLYIVCLGTFSQHVFAEEQVQNPGAFTYKVIHPENQRSNAGYFDLRMTPAKKQTVQIEINNPSDKEEVTVSVSLNSTKTNANGVLEYGPSLLQKDPSMKKDLSDIAKAPESITLKPGEKKNLDIDITMPKDSYDGFISGGIQLKRQLTEAEKKEREKKSGIQNEYAFIIGVLLTETDTKVEPNLEFNKFYAELSNYRNAVFASISNINSAYVDDMTIDMQVMKKGSTEVLYDTKKTTMQMAPNSVINFPLIMNGDEMVPGEYTGHVLVTSNEKKWEWTEGFTISKEEADKYNKQDVSITQERGIDWKLIVMIVCGILIVLLGIFLFVRTLNNKKTEKKRKQSKKKK